MSNEDFDFEKFDQFMRHLSGFYEAVSLNKTSKKIEMMDELEVEISTRPCYNSVNDMLEAIRGM